MHRSVAAAPPICPIVAGRLRPPCTLGATSRKHTLIYVMNIAGIVITRWFFPLDAKYAAHAHSVVAASSWLHIPTYVQIVEKSIVQLRNATANIGMHINTLLMIFF